MSSKALYRSLTVLVVAVAVITPRDVAHAWPSPWIKCYGGDVSIEDFVKAWGVNADRASSYYGKNDVVDVQYQLNGRPASATGLEILAPPDG